MKNYRTILYNNVSANLTGLFIIVMTCILLNWMKPCYADKPHGIFLAAKQESSAYRAPRPLNFYNHRKQLIGYINVETSCNSPTQAIKDLSYRYVRDLAQQAGASDFTITASAYSESMHAYILRARAYKEQV